MHAGNSSEWLTGGFHPSWSGCLDASAVSLLAAIEREVGPGCYPEPVRVLRFLSTDVSALKVVILGQDPYPSAGAATGRAFEVGSLTAWTEPFRQVSLKNILRLLWCVAHGIRPYERETEYERIPAFSGIREAIRKGAFPVASPRSLFQSWEEQGVLLLNTSLTVEPGNPGSHRDLWAPFTQHALSWLATARPDLCWFLWGSHAQAHREWLGDARIFASRHPMLCSVTYPDDFLKNPCFHETSGGINWLGS